MQDSTTPGTVAKISLPQSPNTPDQPLHNAHFSNETTVRGSTQFRLENDQHGPRKRRVGDLNHLITTPVSLNYHSRSGVDTWLRSVEQSIASPATPGELSSKSIVKKQPQNSSARLSPVNSVETDEPDPDDPRVTGVKIKPSPQFIRRDPDGDAGVLKSYQSSLIDFEKFALKLAKALLIFGAPSHRIEAQLTAAATLFNVQVDIIHIPSLIMISFMDPCSDTSEVHFIKGGASVDLDRLQKIHKTYKAVLHDKMNLLEGTQSLETILRQKSIYGMPLRLLFAFLGGAILSPMVFGGSFLDMWPAGATSVVVSWLQSYAAARNRNFGTMVEISAIAIVSFIARGLSMLRSGYFCYSAISSSPTVRALPKYLIVSGSLELASKHIISGSTKMVFGIVYSLFIGFSLTIGSDLYFFVDREAKARREAATEYLAKQQNIQGLFQADNARYQGSFQYTSDADPIPTSRYRPQGCYRDPNWSWYLQPFPLYVIFSLIPVFCTISALASFQPWKSKELFVMVFISCCSYAIDRFFKIWIVTRGEVASAMGAFVIGIMGNLYSRIWGGAAFIAMFVAIGFLVPGNLSQVGGLAHNYRGKDKNEYSQSIELSLRMIQIAIGMTVGLFASGLVVYSFGRKKRGGHFTF